MSQLKESDIILQQIMNKAKGQKATAARSEAKKTKSRKKLKKTKPFILSCV